jgi:hypothetical protein
LARLVLGGLREAPWLRSLTPQEGLAAAQTTAPKAVVPAATPGASEMDPLFYRDRLNAVQQLVDTYAKVAPSEAERLRRLQHNLLIATSSDLWLSPDVASDFVDRTETEILEEMGKIKIVGVNDVTLTSSRGKFQLVLANDTGYPVTVDLDFNAQNQLTFDQEDIEKLSTTYEPGNHPLTIQAKAVSSGKFPLTVQVRAADGFLINEKTIGIRSTVFNRIALTITLGALAFLILFSVLRGFQKRRTPPPETEAVVP